MAHNLVYSTRTTSNSYWTVFLAILTVAVVVAGAAIIFEAARIPGQWSVGAGRAAVTFGLMLVSLAGVVLSVVLPDRLGKSLLLLGALGFFGCLGYALVTSVKF
jgi:uncharacterized membrane protein YhaH (DUF805 family)